MTLWRRLFGRGDLDRELDAELRDHLERQVADYTAQGLSEAEARRRAAAKFGGLDQAKEYCRDQRGTRWIEDLVTDLRYGLRMLAHSRTFTAVAVLSLALGIGANTAIFTLVNSMLLRALPVRAPEELVRIDGEWTNPIWEQVEVPTVSAVFRRDGLVVERIRHVARRPGTTRRRADAPAASSSTCLASRRSSVARSRRQTIAAEAGADLTVAVISYAFWQRQFGGAADVVGRSVMLNRLAFTVIGVLPPEFLGPAMGRGLRRDGAAALRRDARDAAEQSALDGRSYLVARHHREAQARPVRRPGDFVASRRPAADP